MLSLSTGISFLSRASPLNENIMIGAFLGSIITSIALRVIRIKTKNKWMKRISAVVPFAFWIVGLQLARLPPTNS